MKGRKKLDKTLRKAINIRFSEKQKQVLKKILFKNMFYFIYIFFLILILIFGTRIGFVFFSIANFILGIFVLKSAVFYEKAHILSDENEYIQYINKDDFSKKKKRKREAFLYFVYGVIFLLSSFYPNVTLGLFKIIIVFAVISMALVIYLSEKEKNKILYIIYSISIVICCISFLSIFFLVLSLIN